MNLDFGFFNWQLVQSFVLKGLLFSIQLTIIAMIVSWIENSSPLRTKLWTSCQLKKPKSRFITRRPYFAPSMPGIWTRRSTNAATRLTANAETKYSPVTAR